jgi:hypothetical protein
MAVNGCQRSAAAAGTSATCWRRLRHSAVWRGGDDDEIICGPFPVACSRQQPYATSAWALYQRESEGRRQLTDRHAQPVLKPSQGCITCSWPLASSTLFQRPQTCRCIPESSESGESNTPNDRVRRVQRRVQPCTSLSLPVCNRGKAQGAAVVPLPKVSCLCCHSPLQPQRLPFTLLT